MWGTHHTQFLEGVGLLTPVETTVTVKGNATGVFWRFPASRRCCGAAANPTTDPENRIDELADVPIAE